MSINPILSNQNIKIQTPLQGGSSNAAKIAAFKIEKITSLTTYIAASATLAGLSVAAIVSKGLPEDSRTRAYLGMGCLLVSVTAYQNFLALYHAKSNIRMGE